MLQDRQLTINSRYITRSFWLFVVLLGHGHWVVQL